ncbi:MAG: hypothetical protein EBZ77_06110 [Chitinophagia bacterium]|nr:hypothetical protein [Chitinophagia bacterium]
MESHPDIIRYLPQRDPFVLVSAIEEISADSCSTSFTVPFSHYLVKDGRLTAGGLIENIAQTLAAGEAKNAELNDVALTGGYLVSVTRLNISDLPTVNDTIYTHVRLVQSILQYRIITASVTLKDTTIVTAEMKIIVHQ